LNELQNHIEDLPDTADVVIVGAGIIGLACAHYLREQGRSPIVIERGAVGSGSSFGNAGLVAPSHSIPLPAPGVVRKALRWLTDDESPFYIKPRCDVELGFWLLRFAASARRGPMTRGIPVLRDLSRLSTELYAALEHESSLPFKTGGVINVYASEEGFEHGRQEAKLLDGHGLSSEVLSSENLVKQEPSLRPGLAGGVLWPEDGFIEPARFVSEWRARLAGLGVQFVTGAEVLALSADSSGVTVRTTLGTTRSEEVVIAAGAWSAALLKAAKIRIAIQPAKGYSVTIKGASSLLKRPLLLPEAKVAVTPMEAGLRLAGTMELAGLDQTIDLRRVEAVRRSVEPYLQLNHEGATETVWRGLRSLSADGLPMIGRLQTAPRIAVATGHGHIGVSLAPATGKLIAQLLTNDKPAIDLMPLRPDR
jgi:D-amino-acid dehydrogenase